MVGKFFSAAAASNAGGSPSESRDFSRRPRPDKSGGRLRLVQSRDFARVYRQGTRLTSPHFLVVARPNELACTRFGIAVKATLGNAVVRNRIKRRVREVLRQASARVPAGWDVVVEPRQGEVARRKFAPLAAELTELVSAVGQA